MTPDHSAEDGNDDHLDLELLIPRLPEDSEELLAEVLRVVDKVDREEISTLFPTLLELFLVLAHSLLLVFLLLLDSPLGFFAEGALLFGGVIIGVFLVFALA